MRPYYEAYEERYRAVHEKGLRWAGERATPIVADVAARFCPDQDVRMLEIGCGEGRDARALLERGCDLLATDASPEAIAFCRGTMPQYAERFAVLDCLRDVHDALYGFVFAVAVVHMLVLDEDRQGFYRFIREHLTENGVGLICTMGDGETEMRSDVSQAFELKERDHPAGPILVAATSCRMVSFPTFERELKESGFVIAEQGITEAMPDFDKLMYAVVRSAW